MTQPFYDRLAPYYHLLYPDWEVSMERQARGLAAVLEEFGIPRGARILDAACGIGTQTLGLAALGYQLSASDIAPLAVARASRRFATLTHPMSRTNPTAPIINSSGCRTLANTVSPKGTRWTVQALSGG